MSRVKQRTRTDWLCLTISAGEGREEPSEALPGSRNYRYNVGVQSDSTGARIRFDYHGSVHDYDRGVDQLDRDGLLYAFWSFVRDAEMGDGSFADFCADLGYGDDSISVKRMWNECRAARRKLGRLFHDDREPSTLIELLALDGIE